LAKSETEVITKTKGNGTGETRGCEHHGDGAQRRAQVPSAHRRFYPSKVKAVIRKKVDEELVNFKYESQAAVSKANEITASVRDLLKRGAGDFKLLRYKLLVQTVIGELKGQGIRITSQCLWDDKLDNYADCTYQGVD